MRRAICVLLIASVGCYSWRAIPDHEIQERIEAGDKVRVTKTNGEQSIFHVASLTPDRIEGDGRSFLLSEIEKLELRRFSWWKSGLAAGGHVVLAAALTAVAGVIWLVAS